MWHRVKDLSREHRLVLEGLLGRSLHDGDVLHIQLSHLLKDAPSGEERTVAYRDYLAHLDKIVLPAGGVSDEALDLAIDTACKYARSPRA